jgi:molybdenum cofactor synthesis domain-containing protein
MCDSLQEGQKKGTKTIPVREAIGTVLAHDITEIRQGEFKGPAFKKGHVVREEDVCHLQRLGKEQLFVLHVAEDELHENDAANAIATALMGDGVAIKGEPKEGKIDIIAARNGLLKIDRDALLQFNMLGEVMCATLHDNMVVKKGQTIAGTRAIPLVVKKVIVAEAVNIARQGQGSRNKGQGVIQVKEIRKPRAGVVITGNEVYHGKIKDAFAPIIQKKIEEFDGEMAGIYYAPDDKAFILERLRELMNAGADLLITTGGMSVDPDDVTRFAIRELGAIDITYGSAVLPGAMFLVGYLSREHGAWGKEQKSYAPSALPFAEVPIIGIPACGMYHKTTIFDLVLPRILAGERIGRSELAALGHGGFCMNCDACRYPVCSFGKD